MGDIFMQVCLSCQGEIFTSVFRSIGKCVVELELCKARSITRASICEKERHFCHSTWQDR